MNKILLSAMLLAVAGCSNDQQNRQQQAQIDARLKAIEKSEAGIAARLDAVQREQDQKLQVIRSQIDDTRLKIDGKVDAELAAVLDPSVKTFQLIRNDLGVFPVIAEDAQPFLDGYKVRLKVANLTSVIITDVKLDVTYGLREIPIPTRTPRETSAQYASRLGAYFETTDENKKKDRTVTVQAPNSFNPGSWNTVDVVLPESKPEQLGRLEIKLDASGIEIPSRR